MNFNLNFLDFREGSFCRSLVAFYCLFLRIKILIFCLYFFNLCTIVQDVNKILIIDMTQGYFSDPIPSENMPSPSLNPSLLSLPIPKSFLSFPIHPSSLFYTIHLTNYTIYPILLFIHSNNSST